MIEGYLVDHDAPHELKTRLGTEGIHYKGGDMVMTYDPVTGDIANSELLDDETLDFDLDSFNKQVITEGFNRAVLTEIAKDIDPEAPEIQGKTLIYAVDDQHADLIVKILKEIYSDQGVDTDSIMKITGSIGGGNPKKIREAIRRFKNERFPSVVVTVDLLTTGIDVPSITNLVFLRRVKSRILFEQMLGRATRLCPEIHKRVFQIYDPVGVYDSLAPLTSMKPVVANPSQTMTQVLDHMENTDDFFDLDADTAEFERKEAFTGCELVHDTHRLALMNAMLHDIDGEIKLGDTLSDAGKSMKGYDVVLTNPPFGTKKGGERATRDDFTFPTSNKQLNFLQHIYRSLKADGKARAAVVLPDNVLFADGDGEKIRVDLMDKCNLHTVLRLPTGIFYAQGVKTNVLFFTRGATDKGNTKEAWFYDLRTNMPSFGKTNPLKKEDFAGFEKAYTAKDRNAVNDERWHKFTREEIAQKGNSLDLGLIKDDSLVDYEDLPDPVESAQESIKKLGEAMGLLQQVVDDLKKLGVR